MNGLQKLGEDDLNALLHNILLTSGAQCHMISNQKSIVWLKNNWTVGCITFIYKGKKNVNLVARSTALFYYNQVSQIKHNC